MSWYWAVSSRCDHNLPTFVWLPSKASQVGSGDVMALNTGRRQLRNPEAGPHMTGGLAFSLLPRYCRASGPSSFGFDLKLWREHQLIAAFGHLAHVPLHGSFDAEVNRFCL
jgi:hypothetical protein